LKENKIVGLRGVIIDISEIKQTQKVLKIVFANGQNMLNIHPKYP